MEKQLMHFSQENKHYMKKKHMFQCTLRRCNFLKKFFSYILNLYFIAKKMFNQKPRIIILRNIFGVN